MKTSKYRIDNLAPEIGLLVRAYERARMDNQRAEEAGAAPEVVRALREAEYAAADAAIQAIEEAYDAFEAASKAIDEVGRM